MENEKSIQDELDALRRRVAFLEEDNTRLSTLLSVGRAISWQLDLKGLLDLIMKEVTRALEAERSSLFLLDWDRMELWSSVAQGAEEIRFSVKRGIAGYVAMSGESVIIDDAYEDYRFNSSVDQATGFRTRSILAIPIRNQKGDVMGVVEALNKKRGAFTLEDKDLLGALAAQVAIALENAQLYSEIKRTFDSFVDTLTAVIDARHPNTSGHSARVREYSLAIAEELQLDSDEKELVAYAAILHDLGKIGVDDSILKKPGKLDDKEYYEMQRHAAYTRRILSRIHLSEKHRALPMLAAGHHERLDGSGYPDGLRGDEVSLISRILAVADVFDALTCWREYRDPMDGDQALEVIRSGSGARFDPRVVAAFERYYERTGLRTALLAKQQEDQRRRESLEQVDLLERERL